MKRVSGSDGGWKERKNRERREGKAGDLGDNR